LGFLHHVVFTNVVSEVHGDNGFKWMLKGQGRRKVLGYTGRSEEVRPIAATEAGKMYETMTNKWAFRFLGTLLKRFDMTDIILPPYEFRINLNQFSHPEDGGSTFLRNYTVQKQSLHQQTP
jgi:hypothetical protein